MIITSSILAEEPDLIDLIDKFMLRLPVLHDAIISAYKNGDKETFLGFIHQLKGVGGGYGYGILTELCASIEEQATTGNEDNVSMLLDKLNTVVQKILAGHDENHKISEQNT